MITIPGKDLIQNWWKKTKWWRNLKLYRQAEIKRIHHHQTSIATNTKGTSIASKHKRKETYKTNKNKPKIIKKMPIRTYVSIITLNVNGLSTPTKWYRLSSVKFSCSVMSDSLQPHGPQHTRPPFPSPTPGVYPNLCPLSRWCHPTISSSVAPSSSYPQSFQASGLFKWVSCSHQVAKVL